MMYLNTRLSETVPVEISKFKTTTITFDYTIVAEMIQRCISEPL